MPTIETVSALEILDSRGRPTVQATCALRDGSHATVSVPSGASTGAAEAHELRDGDPARYGGLGCRRAVANVNTTINAALREQTFSNQAALDQALLDLDGSADKSSLGANAILAVSLAFARAAAQSAQKPLYAYFAALLDLPLQTMPQLTINLLSGGKHAGKQVPIQDTLVVPRAARNIDEGLAVVYAVYQAAAELMAERYGMRLLTADEGGLAPDFASATAMLDLAVDAISRAGYEPGRDVALALDIASSHFYLDNRYHLDDRALTGAAMVDELATWVERYPIVSLEDGLAEEDWTHWPALCRRLGKRILVLGDDFLCTNPNRIQQAIDTGAANALLLKVNQIGTLSEAATAYQLARAAGWQITISARSGETEDNWLADLAVGWAGDQIKIGSITQSERLAKYNRLLAIEAETQLPLVNWP